MKYLMYFHIGPVQGFISTARRTYDLWGGSWILSELCKAAIERVSLNPQNTIIFPVLTSSKNQSFYANSPNKFMALLSANTDDEAKAQAVEAERAVREKSSEFFSQVKATIEKNLTNLSTDPEWNQIWMRQTENYFEIYWVILKVDENILNSRDSYTEIQRKIREALNARKRIRNFTQQIERGPRCSLCGTLEQLTDSKRKHTFRDYQNFWQSLSVAFQGSKYEFTLKSGERLCSICITKRLLPVIQMTKIPSTSTVSVSNLLYRIANSPTIQCEEKLETMLMEYYEKFTALELPLFNTSASNVPAVSEVVEKLPENFKKVLSLDGDAFIEDTLDVKALKQYTKTAPPDRAKVSEARESLRKILSCLRAHGETPSKYFALIMADGDSVGKIMSGAKGKLSFTEHREISKVFSEFANNVVPHTIERLHRGKIIYWGGDEGLVMCPLEDLISIIHYLRAGFCGQWREENQKFIPDLMLPKSKEIKYQNRNIFSKVPGDLTTLSVGAVIAHHQEYLPRVLEEARDALDRAKGKHERDIKRDEYKDSFSITILRRSGEPAFFTSKYLIADLDILKTLKQLVGFYRNGLSDSWIFELKRESLTLQCLDSKVLSKEILRIISRRKLKEGTVKPEDLKDTFETVLEKVKDINYFVSLNEVASYIAKGGGA